MHRYPLGVSERQEALRMMRRAFGFNDDVMFAPVSDHLLDRDARNVDLMCRARSDGLVDIVVSVRHENAPEAPSKAV